MKRDLEVAVQWEDVVHELFVITGRFPKSVRFVIANRIANLALDIMSLLVEAQYAPTQEQPPLLSRASVLITQLRVLLRISARERWLSLGQLDLICTQIDVVGKRIYVWRQKQNEKHKKSKESLPTGL